MDSEAWRAAVHGVTESLTQLNWTDIMLKKMMLLIHILTHSFNTRVY